jgi:hypothetical protein
MARHTGARTALALLLALLGVGSVFLTWHRAAFLGIADADDGWERWQGVAAAALFGGCAACILLSRRRDASAWWHTLGYLLLPLATVGVLCWYAWDFLPAGLRARLGSGTRLGAAFKEFDGAFKWSSIGVGAYAAFALAVGIVLVGMSARARKGRTRQ